MNFWLNYLQLQFRRETVQLPFGHINFYWGKIGAGKTSIAKLIDYCLAANIDFSPALQTEFNSAQLNLSIEGRPLLIDRERGSDNVIASWQEADGQIEAVIPTRIANGVAVQGTRIEVLSDLVFHLAGISAPMVRKGRRSDDGRLERLSLRDIFRFCYVDQDKIDSDFFKLDAEADPIRRAKSIDTMRYILGYHQDEVANLEAQLQQANEQKLAATVAAETLAKALKDAGFDDAVAIEARVQQYREEWKNSRDEAKKARENRGVGGHAVDDLQASARSLAVELQSLTDMASSVTNQLDSTERHINELKMLSVRFNRTKSARALLAAVDFTECPRCTQLLPLRRDHECPVCGQEEVGEPHDHISNEVVEADLKMRLSELSETHAGLEKQKLLIERQIGFTKEEKSSVDRELSQRMAEYDSAFLSQALRFERQMTSLEQKAKALQTYRTLPEKLAELEKKAAEYGATAIALRTKVAAARAAAFEDRENLKLLEAFFLDCLVRSSFPGVALTDRVEVDARTFEPIVMPTEDQDFAVTSFSNMSSGGMKTVFKACYALALHRVASKKGSPLPKILILDSSMKNVSERENQEVFQSFYGMVYELAAGELADTQFILIDKEFYEPSPDLGLDIRQRQMAPGSVEHPPLIPYYRVPQDQGTHPLDTGRFDNK